MRRKYIGFFDSTYALLIFFIVHTDKIKQTFFFISDGIPQSIHENINCIFKKHPKKPLSKIKTHFFLKKIKKEVDFHVDFNVTEVFGQDHIFWAQPFLNKYNNINIFEDGFSSYTQPKKINFRFKKVKKILRRKDFSPYGVSDKVSKIYLTGLMPIPEIIKEKVVIIDLQDLWDNKTLEEKEMILNIFNLSVSKMSDMACKKVVLLTQTLSEDNLMSEEEKIELYRQILEPYKSADVLIKPHPREKTNYKKLFPEYEVISEQFPVQLFNLNHIHFEEVVTVFSTAANDFLDGKTKLVFKGTKFNEKIYKQVGNIFYDQETKKIKVEKYEK